ncbi:MAG: DUF6497 family protein [Pseudomonadota bacterium]
MRALCAQHGFAVLALLVLCVPAAALQMPSGKSVTLLEVLRDQVSGEDWLRFRFVAEGISRADPYETTADDMLYLCERQALPYLHAHALRADVVVISLADRATEFGVADPEVVQFFEAFRPDSDVCMWEAQ